jgi:citrate synthase
MPKNSLTITDNRTNKTYEIPISDGTIRGIDPRQIKAGDEDFGLMSYDPAFTNTASCRSAITFIDGDKGILRYRGYQIAELAEQATYLEVAYLLLYGELPTADQLAQWNAEVANHMFVHENVKSFMSGFRYDAHPMGMFVGSVGALSTFYPDAKTVEDPELRRSHIIRLIAKMPTIAAWSYRHSVGMPFVYPNLELSYAANFLNMLKTGAPGYTLSPEAVRALDVLFILHADHEQNCSTNVMRSIGSSQADPYSALAGAAAALYGPLHGGANEAVLHMLREIGSLSNVPAFIKEVKEGVGGRLMGFGHRVYKNYDPRAKVIKVLADQVFAVTGKKNPLLQVALELEKIALSDDYFIKRKLYPNVDFYSGLIYEALGIPIDMFPVMFAIPRTSGWLAQWEEMLLDKEQKIARPRQVYTGHGERSFVAMPERKALLR